MKKHTKKKLQLLLGFIAFDSSSFGQDETYVFRIALGHISMEINENSDNYTVVNLDDFCPDFKASTYFINYHEYY